MAYVTRAEFADWIEHDSAMAQTLSAERLDLALNSAGLKIDRLCNRRFAPSNGEETWRHYLAPDTGMPRPVLLIRDAVTITSVEDAEGVVDSDEYTEVRVHPDHPISSLIRVRGDDASYAYGGEGRWIGPYVDITGEFGWAEPDASDPTLSVAPDDIKLAQLVEGYKYWKLRQLPFGQPDGMGGALPLPKYNPSFMDLIASYRRRAPGGARRPVKIG